MKANLLLDYQKDSSNAELAFEKAIALDLDYGTAHSNLAWSSVLQGNLDSAQRIAEGFEPEAPGVALLTASISLRQANLGNALDQLTDIFTNNPEWLWQNCSDDVLRLTRVVKESGFSKPYIEWLKRNKFDITLAPYVAAATAWLVDPDHLKRINPEIRTAAESMYDWLTLTEKGGERGSLE